jgi:YYY domain-containing protein
MGDNVHPFTQRISRMSDFAAFLTWYLASTLAGAVALPLAFRLFDRLPDRGYTFARPLGILLTGYVFWLLCVLGFLRNDAGGVVIAALLVLVGGVAWLTRAGLTELRVWLRANVSTVLRVEIVFLLAFAVWTYVRAHNPEISATEKPMDFMFINAILRSPAFPPNDAWLAGHAISYYYFGYLLVAALTHVTGVASSVAYNLALALFFALTATGALGVALNLIALSKDDGGRPKDEALSVPPADFRLPPACFWPALLAPLVIVVAGNWYGVLKLAHTNGVARDLQIPAVYYSFGDAATGEQPGWRAGLLNVWTWFDLKGANDPVAVTPEQWTWDPGYWWWFNGARVTHDKNLLGQETEAITEMPAFSFILGDLHPHVMALPFVFLPLALAVQWMLWAMARDREPAAGERPNYQLLIAALPRVPILLSAVLLGALIFLNTWDFPIYWFVIVMAFALGLGMALGWDEVLRRWVSVALFAGVLAGPALAAYVPYFLTFQSQAGGILPNLIYPTRFQQTVVMFAHVLVAVTLFVGWLAVRQWRQLDRRAALWAGGGIVGVLSLAWLLMLLIGYYNPDLASFAAGFLAPLTFGEALSLTLQRRLVDSATPLVSAIFIGLTVGLGVAALRARPSPGGRGAGGEGNPPSAISHPSSLILPPSLLFALLLTLTGALLLLGPEFVYLRDFFGTRMNTIFKFYFQVWVVWGLAGSFGLWYLWQHARPSVRGFVSSLAGLAMVGSLVYTLAATYSKANHFTGSATLDGMAYFAQQSPDDWAAIQWLNNNMRGSAVIVEAVGGSYTQFGRIAMGTGLPTLMGWDFHERQWRGAYYDKVDERIGQVEALYRARDLPAALADLDQDDFKIEYVILGELERQRYGPINAQRFEQTMQPVFQSGNLTIYQRVLTGAR